MGTLTAQKNAHGWIVVDSKGGQWWPDTLAQVRIANASNPAAETLRLCTRESERGTWVY